MFSGLMSVGMAILVLAGGAMGVTNGIPYSANFEGNYSPSGYITSTTNDATPQSQWVAAAASYMTATSSPAATAPYPLSGSHSQVAKLDTEGGSITNHLDGSGESQVWLDMNIQMVPSDAEPTVVTNDTGIQTAMYVATNGDLNVYCTPAVGAGSNMWAVLSGTGVDTGKWHRLTVSMAYNTEGFFNGDYFQVTLNGDVLTNEYAFTNPNTYPPQKGDTNSWFLCANQGTGHSQINQCLFSGTGYLDDFVVTNSEPTQATSSYLHGVPGWWLGYFGIEESDTGATNNVDGDMYVAWQEWLLGTNPKTVSNDFQLVVESNGGTNTLKWVTDSGLDTTVDGKILLYKSTNLLEGYTSTNDSNARNTLVEGLNTWEDTTGGDAMYRLGVSTD